MGCAQHNAVRDTHNFNPRSFAPLYIVNSQARMLEEIRAQSHSCRYKPGMKDRDLIFVISALASISLAADTPNFAGEFADKRFLNG
jgi:hypothetical protein